MNLQGDISSGILELYLLGALSAEERAGVEEMIAQHPELKEELVRIEMALRQYAEASAAAPPESVKAELWQKLRIAGEDKVAVAQDDGFTGKLQSTKRLLTWLLAASVALLIISNIVTFYYYNQYQKAKDNLVALQSQNDALAGDIRQAKDSLSVTRENVRDSFARLDRQLALLRSPEYIAVQLRGKEKKQEASVKVFWNKNSNEVYVTAADLPEPPAGMAYQLWALQNAIPVDAGMIDFSSATRSVAQMKKITSADAFAITLEKEGGSPVPTLTRMYAIGKMQN